MARGIERCRIFVDDPDRIEFIARLTSVLIECSITCFAWALMPNHVHLALCTGDHPLATAMARLLTGYAVYFNRRHDRVGHLFQNRYRSIPVDDDEQLLTLIRYIHLNPLRAGIVGGIDELADYPWAGHAPLLGTRRAPFQDTRRVLSWFGDDSARARARLVRWMSSEESDRIATGSTSTDPLDALIERTCRALGTRADLVLRAGRGGVASDVRALVAHVASTDLGYGPRELGRRLELSHVAILKAVARGARLIEGHPALRAVGARAVAEREQAPRRVGSPTGEPSATRSR
jgi:REP element-mobilizing transposase RayT